MKEVRSNPDQLCRQVPSPLDKKNFTITIERPPNRRYAPMIIDVSTSSYKVTSRRVANHTEKLAQLFESKGFSRAHGFNDNADITCVGDSIIGVSERLANAVADWLLHDVPLNETTD